MCLLARTHTHKGEQLCVCVCVLVWLGKLGVAATEVVQGQSQPPGHRPGPVLNRTEPHRTEPHWAHSEEVTLDKPLPTGWLQSECWAWSVAPTTTRTAAMIAKHTHTHTNTCTGTGTQAHAHTVKWHVHTYLNMMRNFNFPWLIHMVFGCHIHIVVNLVNLSLDPNSGWLFRLDFMARRPRSGNHIWFIILLILPMCDCNVNQLNTHFLYFVNFLSLSTNSLKCLNVIKIFQHNFSSFAHIALPIALIVFKLVFCNMWTTIFPFVSTFKFFI